MNLSYRTHQWGGLAFMVGNVLFIVNKLDEMSRLFLSRGMSDVISGQNVLLILLGQIALIIGYLAFQKVYLERVGKPRKIALRLFCYGGVLVAIGHISFMTALIDDLPITMQPYAEYLFILVMIGMLLLLTGLIWFGILNFRSPILGRWQWLPLATGIMGFIGFILFSGEEITAVFLVFRTLFALGLMGLGLTMLMEKPVQVYPKVEKVISI